MALFNDGPPSDMEDLVCLDSQLPDVASGEGIDTTSKLLLAQEQAAMEIRALLDHYTPGPPTAGVVVTPPLKLWHAYWTLELIYADVYFNVLNDRYREKRDQFHAERLRTREYVIEAGIGVAWDPIPKAATPILMPASGFLEAGTYYAAITWVNRRGEESSPANPDNISLVSGSFSVAPGAAPPMATGWNVYAGTDAGNMVLQNDAPLLPAAVWTQSAAVHSSGRGPGTGQSPNDYYPVPRVLQRG
jgi:hypothetical protein